ncbi:hypothetical protein JL720_10562 [Aureococcus anophagefferens]|nr:hypothetical protein JL720_10562 [Aureococcus anophagefferens]
MSCFDAYLARRRLYGLRCEISLSSPQYDAETHEEIEEPYVEAENGGRLIVSPQVRRGRFAARRRPSAEAAPRPRPSPRRRRPGRRRPPSARRRRASPPTRRAPTTTSRQEAAPDKPGRRAAAGATPPAPRAAPPPPADEAADGGAAGADPVPLYTGIEGDGGDEMIALPPRAPGARAPRQGQGWAAGASPSRGARRGAAAAAGRAAATARARGRARAAASPPPPPPPPPADEEPASEAPAAPMPMLGRDHRQRRERAAAAGGRGRWRCRRRRHAAGAHLSIADVPPQNGDPAPMLDDPRNSTVGKRRANEAATSNGAADAAAAAPRARKPRAKKKPSNKDAPETSVPDLVAAAAADAAAAGDASARAPPAADGDGADGDGAKKKKGRGRAKKKARDGADDAAPPPSLVLNMPPPPLVAGAMPPPPDGSPRDRSRTQSQEGLALAPEGLPRAGDATAQSLASPLGHVLGALDGALAAGGRRERRRRGGRRLRARAERDDPRDVRRRRGLGRRRGPGRGRRAEHGRDRTHFAADLRGVRVRRAAEAGAARRRRRRAAAVAAAPPPPVVVAPGVAQLPVPLVMLPPAQAGFPVLVQSPVLLSGAPAQIDVRVLKTGRMGKILERRKAGWIYVQLDANPDEDGEAFNRKTFRSTDLVEFDEEGREIVKKTAKKPRTASEASVGGAAPQKKRRKKAKAGDARRGAPGAPRPRRRRSESGGGAAAAEERRRRRADTHDRVRITEAHTSLAGKYGIVVERNKAWIKVHLDDDPTIVSLRKSQIEVVPDGEGGPAPAPEAPPPPAGAGADDDDSGGGVGTVMSVGAGNMFYVRRDGDGDGEEVACHGDEIEDVAVGDERSRTEDGEESQSDPIIDRLEAGCAALAAAPVAPPPVAAPPPVVAPPARARGPRRRDAGAYAHIEEGSRLRERDGARECTLLSKGKCGWWTVQWDGEDQEASAAADAPAAPEPAAPEPEPEPAAPEPEPEPAAPEPEPSPRRRAPPPTTTSWRTRGGAAEVLEEASAQQAAAMNKDDAYAPGAPVMVLASEPKADGVVRGVVSEVQSGGWRKITLDGMSYPHESSFRPSRLVALNADNTPYEFQSPEDPLARWTPTSTPPSEEDARAGARVTANGWVKVFMDECDDDDDVESYRMAQLRPEAAPEPAAAEEPPKKKKKSAAKRTARMAELTEVLSAGRRVAILDLSPDEHPLHTPVDVTVERLGKGTITSVKGAGYRLVRYDAPLADGTVEVSARPSRLVPLVARGEDLAHARRAVGEARRQEARGSASRDAGDGAAVCECLTAAEWNSYVDAILCGEAAPLTGNGSSSRGPMGAPPQLSRAPLVRAPGESDDDARFRQRSAPARCDGDCLNRNLQIECNPATCPMGDKCQNRCFAAKLGSKVSVEKADQCGWGLFAGEPIAKRAFVVEALGELISEEEAQERLATARANGDEDYYMLAASDAATKGLVIDATRKGNEARFANHSCDPSCRLEKWRCGSQDRYGIFALRSVKPGEQLTYDYRWASFERCYCGAANCVGVMDGVKKNPVGAAARGGRPLEGRDGAIVTGGAAAAPAAQGADRGARAETILEGDVGDDETAAGGGADKDDETLSNDELESQGRGAGRRRRGAAADDADLEAMEAMGENDTVGGGSASPSKKRAASGDDDGPAVAATFLGSPAAKRRADAAAAAASPRSSPRGGGSSPRDSEDLETRSCWVCKEAGEIILCKECNRCFHYDCAGITVDDYEECAFWHCRDCAGNGATGGARARRR